MDNTFLCDCCKLQKQSVTPKKSELLGTQFLLCSTCIKSGMQPRWSIIVAAQTFGLTDTIKDYLRNRKYFGKPISAKDIV